MRISNIIFPCAAVWLCGLQAPVRADEIAFGNGDERMTGVVRSISQAGVVELQSPNSPEPVLLKSASIGRIDFAAAEKPAAPQPAMVELINGDTLPCTIESLDEKTMTIVSPDAGRLEIARDFLSCAQFGMRERKVIYQGPRNLNEWTESNKENWSFNDGGLVANGKATASKNLALPEQFIIRFTLKWQARQMPNFKVYFADPLQEKGALVDRYYVQYGGAGFEIKRESAKGRRFTPIIQLNRLPSQYAQHQLPVEIRVDRKNSRMLVFLDGQPEGEFVDPVTTAPIANGVAIECNGPNNMTQEISGIEILEFDESRGRHHSEERGDSKLDSLISREEDRWGGRLLDIRKKGDSSVFRFKSDFQKDPMEITEKDVSTVFFSRKEQAATQPAPYSIRTNERGGLKVSSYQLTADGVTAVHPLLGTLKLRREGIVSLERPDAGSRKSKAPGKP